MLLLLLLPLLFHHSYSATILVDGVSPWPNPTVRIGDSVVFKHKYGFNLYIFKNQKAFSACNFTLATLLTSSTSNSFTWYPSRRGFYYFAFSNASLNSCTSEYSQKLAVKVSLPPPPPVASPIPAPIPGGEVSASPAYPWPFPPRDTALSPAPTPTSGGANSPMTMPAVVPGERGENMPFINSNPAVPLPTGEVDSATIRPLSTSGHRQQVAVGLCGGAWTLFCGILLLLM